MPASSLHHVTRREDRVPIPEKIGIGLGRVAVDGTAGALHTLVNQVYNMMLGVNPALLSTAVFIQRIWDAMLDPLWGQFSDNFRSRWGRRLPLMALGALPMALCFGAIWWFPRGFGSTSLFYYLVASSLIFYFFQTMYAMPLNGLLIEATNDYHERTRVATVAIVFALVFMVIGQWLFPLMQWSGFSDPVSGVRWVASIAAGVFFIIALMPVVLCKEHNYHRVAAHQAKISLREGLVHVRSNRPLRHVILARLIASFTYNVVGMLGIYMNTYYVFGGDIKRAAPFYGVLGSSYMIAGAVCSIFIYPWLSRKLGKRRTFQFAALILVCGCIAKLVVYQPGEPWLQLVVLIANGASGAGMTVMVTAMLGDLADYNELHSGQRNEAFLGAIILWFDKAGNSVGALLGGFVLVWIGFDAATGVQSAPTLQLMKWSYCVLPLVGALIAIGLMQLYELDENTVYQIKAELELRHAQQEREGSAPVAI